MATKKSYFQKFPLWFKVFKIAAAGITILSVTIFGVGQQMLRLGANDPQIQMAEDAARALNKGTMYQSVLPAMQQVDIAESLAPFMAIYNSQGRLLASTAVLDNMSLQYPAGVFQYVDNHGEDRVTWQPRPGVRIASVVVPYDGGYVLTGRNLHQVEHRVSTIAKVVLLGWLLSILLTALGALLFFEDKKRVNGTK